MSDDATAGGSSIAASVRTLFKSGILVLFATYFDYGISFLGKIVIADYLGKVDYGFVSIGVVIVGTINTFALLGLNVGVSRFLPRFSNSSVRKQIVSAGFYLALIPTVVISVVLIVFADELAVSVFRDSTATFTIQVFAAVAPFAIIKTYGHGTIKGLERTLPKIIIENVLDPVVRIALIGVVVAFALGRVGGIAAYSLPYVIGGVVTLWYLWRHSPFTVFPPSLSTAVESDANLNNGLYTGLLVFSIPLAVTGAMSMVLSDIDTYFLAAFTGVGTVGVYHVIYPLATLLSTFLSSFSFLVIPLISKHHAEGDIEGMKHLYITVVKWIVALALPLFVILLFQPATVIQLTFGPEFTEGATALSILAIGMFFNAFVGPVMNCLTSIGRNRLVMVNTVAVGGSNIVLNYLLIPEYGLVGAAVATTLSYVVLNIIGIVQLYYIYDIQPFSLASFVLPVAAIGIFLGVRNVATGFTTGMEPALSFLTTIAVFGLLYIGVALVIVYGDDERDILNAIVERFAV